MHIGEIVIPTKLLLVVLGLHFLFCLLLTLILRKKSKRLPSAYGLIVFCIPFFGLLSFLLVWFQEWRHQGRKMEIPLDAVRVEENLYKKFIQEDIEDANQVIPLEEALFINDAAKKRQMMMSILHENPKKNINLLKMAQSSDDVEVIHYATTSILELQKDFEAQLQSAKKAYESHLSPEHLEDYIGLLEEYLESRLISEAVLKERRLLLTQLLNIQIKQNPGDLKASLSLVRHYRALKMNGEAKELLRKLRLFHSREEIVWLETLKFCIDSQDEAELSQVLEEISDRPMWWSKEGKEKISFLKKKADPMQKYAQEGGIGHE